MGRALGGYSSKIRELVIQDRKDNPYITLQMIGDKFNVSKQRVYQFLKRERIRAGHVCRKHPCPQCGREVSLKNVFCSKECLSEFHRITLICDECGKSFKRRLSDAFYTLRAPRTPAAPVKLWFCNQKCHGKHVVKYRKGMVIKARSTPFPTGIRTNKIIVDFT